MLLKGHGESMIGSFDDIQKSGFDIDEILQSYNQTLAEKKKDKKDDVKTETK